MDGVTLDRVPAETYVPVAEFAACLHCRRVLSATMRREETARDAAPPARALLTEAIYCQRCARPTDAEAPLAPAVVARLTRLVRVVFSGRQRRARAQLYDDVTEKM